MKVHVIMGSDYPDRVFQNEEHAVRYVTMKKEIERRENRYESKIYWRYDSFELETNDVT